MCFSILGALAKSALATGLVLDLAKRVLRVPDQRFRETEMPDLKNMCVNISIYYQIIYERKFVRNFFLTVSH